jgi:hypothetical protein
MWIHRRALVTLLVALALGTGTPRPSIAPASPAGKAAARAARNARRAHKRLVRAVRTKGLASLPAVSAAFASNGTQGADVASSADVVGTPPTLVDIVHGDASQLFWRPGIVAAVAGGTATPAQCAEFSGTQTDGLSAGINACRLAETLAQSFGRVLESEGSLCYMRELPTPANVHAGGVQVVSGEPPDGNLTRLFSVPAAHDRTVEVRLQDQSESQRVMLRVASAAANRAAGNLYKVDIWFCPSTPGGDPTGSDILTLDMTGHLVVVEGRNNSDGSTSVDTVDGWVVGDGPGAMWDTSRPRNAQIAWGDPQGTFKSTVQLVDDEITTWSWGSYGDQRGFAVTRFSGTSPADVRFLSGAFEEAGQPGPGTAEYRDPSYVAAPGLDLLSQVNAEDMSTDPFFATPPTMPTIDVSGYSCATPGDVVLAIDFSSPAIAAIQAECEGPQLDGIEFCTSNPAVQSATQNFGPTCGGP